MAVPRQADWSGSSDTRGSALWGKGGTGRARGAIATIAAIVAILIVPAIGHAGNGNGPTTGNGNPPTAGNGPVTVNGNGPGSGNNPGDRNGNGNGNGNGNKTKGAYVPAALLARAAANPNQMFHVIVQGDKRVVASSDVAASVTAGNGQLKRALRSIDGVSATISGANLAKLANAAHIVAITPDARMGTASDWQDSQGWTASTGIAPLWGTLAGASSVPAIAIIDSGVDPTKIGDFGSRLVASVNLSSLTPDATGDDEGHGTMVAGVAAGASTTFPGAAPGAPIVSIRTSDQYGQSLSSDVIAACDWVLAHKDQYDIRVVNLSLVESGVSSFRFNPLDKAVESLWLNGIVVTAAAGNYGTGTAVDTGYAPGNDPFVITVGALDQNGTALPANDTLAPWSAFGDTADGFLKPELSAPGRYIVAPVPASSYLKQMEPSRVVAPGYMWMSGTSFAAPMAAGAAAQLLALHPDWTPDQVKGALMVSAASLPAIAGFGGGVGEIDAAAAAGVSSPPNPDENLDSFVVSDSTGAHFDGDAWATYVATASEWSASEWSASEWSASEWSASEWSASEWSASEWSASEWSASEWSASDLGASGWSATIWKP